MVKAVMLDTTDKFLSVDDHRLVNAVKAAFLEELGTEGLIPTALRLIAQALDSHFVSFQACDADMTILGGDTYPPNDEESMRLIPTINQHLLADHPVVPYLLDRHVTCLPKRYSDFGSNEAFWATDLYKNAYGKLGWKYQMTVAIWDESSVSHGISVNRRDRDFDERDRSLLQQIYPLFLKAMRCNYLMNERLNQLRTGVKLTQRESEILHWIAEGKSNFEIGVILGVSNRTVDTHRANLFKKLSFENRGAAVKYVSVMKRLTFNGRDDVPELE